MQRWSKAYRERRAIEALIAFALSNPSEAQIAALNRKLQEREKAQRLKDDEWLNAHGRDRY